MLEDKSENASPKRSRLGEPKIYLKREKKT